MQSLTCCCIHCSHSTCPCTINGNHSHCVGGVWEQSWNILLNHSIESSNDVWTIRLYHDAITGGRVSIGTRSAGHNKSISHWTYSHQRGRLGGAERRGVSHKLAKDNSNGCPSKNGSPNKKTVLGDSTPPSCGPSTYLNRLIVLKKQNSPFFQ